MGFLRMSTSLHADITKLIVEQSLFYSPINKTVPILWFWFSFDTLYFGCPHPSSSGRALVHEKTRMGKPSPHTQWQCTGLPLNFPLFLSDFNET